MGKVSCKFSVPASSAKRHAPYVNVARVYYQGESAAGSKANWYVLKRIYQRHGFFLSGIDEKSF